MPIKFRWPQDINAIRFGSVLVWGGIAGIINTVTGTSPLSLVNALAGSIKSLVQYGLCTQTSTPTPSSSVDIKCNNGVIKAKHQSGLPLGYQKLDYVAGKTGQTVVDTGVTGDLANLRIVVRAKKTTHSAYSSFFGNYVDENTNCTRIIEGGAESSPVLFTYNGKAGGGSASASGVFSADAHTYDLSSSGLVVDGDKSFENREVSGTSNSTNIAICNSKVNATPASSGVSTVFAYFKIYQGETLIRDYVPAKRLSDNKVGFYELVNNTFEPGIFASSYAFTAGSPVDDLVELYVDGTPEVLTVNGANMLNPATVPNDGKYIAKANGQVAGTASTWAHSGFIPVEEGKKYYFGYKPFTASAAGMAWYDSSKTYISGKSATEIRSSSQKLTAPSGASFVRFTWSTANGYDTDWRNTVYFCEDGAMTKFEPYVTPQTASVENLFAVGDTKDEQDIISGLLTHKVGIKVFDGTENWELHAAASGTYRLDGVFTDLAQGVPILSSLLCTNFSVTDTLATADFTTGMARWSGSSVGTVVVTTSGTRLYACFGMSTVQEVKAFLAAQYAAGTPVIVVYPLAQEITETVTPQPLHTAEGTNAVTVTAEVNPIQLTTKYTMAS